MESWLASRVAVREQRGIIRHDAQRNESMIDLASNDYLGLAGDQRLAVAAAEATTIYGTGARASRVVCGTTQAHLELERELCSLTGQETALAFSSGYAANLGVITALGGPGTLMIYDAHVHASIHDGIRLSRSPAISVAHGDLEAIRCALAQRTQPRAVVVLESIYSVLGDAADLVTAAALCAEMDALLLVDEAHGIGVAGNGRGAVHAAGLAEAGHVILTLTLSKALGSQGGAVLGPALLREHLVNTARTFIFDTALAPACAAAAAQGARIIMTEPQLVTRMHHNAATIAARCGIQKAPGAVQSIPVASSASAAALSAGLREAGVAVGCFRPPSVPDGVSRLRLTARANLKSEELEQAASLVAAAVRAL
ncbi:8-amino-7-oxononanoate synthase [Arthrobacter cryoconiti]|nr:8-amino-7-oxononanoate synthase [Arthrobacter cryoconiti]